MMLMSLDWATQRLINLMNAWRERKWSRSWWAWACPIVKDCAVRSDLLTYTQRRPRYERRI